MSLKDTGMIGPQKRIQNNRFSGAQCNEEMKCKGRRVVTVFKNFVGETLVDHIAAYESVFLNNIREVLPR